MGNIDAESVRAFKSIFDVIKEIVDENSDSPFILSILYFI